MKPPSTVGGHGVGGWFRVSLAIVLTVLASSGYSATFAGRAVHEVLEELSRGELTLIFNDQLVPDRLQVLAEPSGSTALELVAQILAPHNLGLLPISGNAYAVVAKPAPVPSVDVAADGDASPDVKWVPLPPLLPEVVVSTSRYSLAYEQSGSHTFFTQSELASLPKAAEEPLRAVHRLPGSASGGVSARSYLRGGAENETLVRLDGMALSEPFHAKDLLNIVSVVDSGIVAAMDVYSGGFGAELGNHMSGVVDITTIAPPAAKYFEAGVSLFHTNALASGRLGDGAVEWLVSARRSNLDEVGELAQSDIGEPKYSDAFGSLRYEWLPSTAVAFRFLRSTDSIAVNNGSKTQISAVSYDNSYLWATLEHDWSEALHGFVTVSATHIENQRNGSVDEPGERTGQVDDRRSLRSATLTGELVVENGVLATRVGFSAGRLAAGYDYQSDIDFLQPLVPPLNGDSQVSRDFKLRPEGQAYAAYITSRIRLSDRLTAEAGGRWDRQTYVAPVASDQFSPRIGLLFDLNAATRLRASWGRFFQAQPINGLQVEDGVDQFFPAQRADHTIIGLDRVLAEDFDLRVEMYRKDFTSLQPRFENLFDSLVLLPELEADRVRVAPRRARAEGVEMLVTHRGRGPWSWWLNYAWSRVEDDIDGVAFPRSWDQRHALKLGATRSGDKWDLSIAATLRSGWPTTLASLETVDDGEGNLTEQVVVGARNGARLGSFSSVDIKATRRFKLRASELEAFIDITNVLLRLNPCCVAYSVSEPVPGSPELGREIEYWPKIVPNLGVLWKF